MTTQELQTQIEANRRAANDAKLQGDQAAYWAHRLVMLNLQAELYEKRTGEPAPRGELQLREEIAR